MEIITIFGIDKIQSSLAHPIASLTDSRRIKPVRLAFKLDSKADRYENIKSSMSPGMAAMSLTQSGVED